MNTNKPDEHTPIPWQINVRGDHMCYVGPVDNPTFDAARVMGVDAREQLANGYFIVRACNEHEALLAQRDELLAVLTDFYCELLKTGGASNATIERVRNATGMTESPA